MMMVVIIEKMARALAATKDIAAHLAPFRFAAVRKRGTGCKGSWPRLLGKKCWHGARASTFAYRIGVAGQADA
jgi:hypothetical protein